MGPRSDYLTGTITLENGEIAFTGTGTGWLAAGFQEGDTIIDVTGATEFMGVIATISANGAGTLTKAWEGPDLTAVAYRMRYQADGQRVTAQARELIELLGNGNLAAFAGLSGSLDKIPYFTAPGAMGLLDKADLLSGLNVDFKVELLSERAAYDDQLEGTSVFVNDIEDGTGRAATYFKVTDASGDWSTPGFFTGDTGPAPELDNVNVTDVPYDTPGSGTFTETAPGVYDLDLDIPKGRGYNPRGTYSGATAYDPDDTVLDNGSTWRAKIATTGNAPPTLPTTSNTQWELVAAKGLDGTGTGDVIGPASSVNDRIAVFDGTTGKLLKDGGSTIATINASIATKIGMGKAVAAALVFGG